MCASLLSCLVDSLIHWLIDSLFDSLVHCFILSSVHSLLYRFIGSVAHRFIGTMIHSVSFAWIVSCPFIGISTTICLFTDAPHSFNTSLLLRFRNFPIGHFLPIEVLFCSKPPPRRLPGTTGMYVCMYVCMFVCMYVRTYVCMYVCKYIYIYKPPLNFYFSGSEQHRLTPIGKSMIWGTDMEYCFSFGASGANPRWYATASPSNKFTQAGWTMMRPSWSRRSSVV